MVHEAHEAGGGGDDVALDRDPDEEAIENKFSAEMNAQVVVDAENYYQVSTTPSQQCRQGGRQARARRQVLGRRTVCDLSQPVLTAFVLVVQVMMQGNHESWNVRDKHMADTLESIAKFYGTWVGGRRQQVQPLAVTGGHHGHSDEAPEKPCPEEWDMVTWGSVRSSSARRRVVVQARTPAVSSGSTTRTWAMPGPPAWRHPASGE